MEKLRVIAQTVILERIVRLSTIVLVTLAKTKECVLTQETRSNAPALIIGLGQHVLRTTFVRVRHANTVELV